MLQVVLRKVLRQGAFGQTVGVAIHVWPAMGNIDQLRLPPLWAAAHRGEIKINSRKEYISEG